MHILYLHGFRSAPASFKASLLADSMAQAGRIVDWTCPQLPASPRAAAKLAWELAQPIVRAAAGNDPAEALTVIGSSLGGYYTTWLAEQTGCRAVLLNPCVHAARDLSTQIGKHQQYHADAPFVFLPEYIDELHHLWVPQLTRLQRYLLIAAKGDELLDWREMAKRYTGAQQHIIDGSDHGLSDFATLTPMVLDFARPGGTTASLPPN
jgi:predicted esterase YcpF (UPF0227 family)